MQAKIISLSSFVIGIFVIFIFYNFSAMLKFKYLDIKKNYTNDDKYLASITENGLWIKDEIENKINDYLKQLKSISAFHKLISDGVKLITKSNL